MRRCCQISSLALCSLPLFIELPGWSVTSWVGGCWGALLLTGLSATWTTNRAAWCLYCVLISILAQTALVSLTDLGPYASWLIIAMLLSSGWLTGIAVLPWNGPTRIPGQELNKRASGSERYRFSAWDIFCATTLVAMFCWTVPNVENQFELMCQVGPPLVGGVVLSTLALQWAWKDRWSLPSLASMLLCLGLSTLLIVPWSNLQTNYWTLIAWVVAGPLSVMAAQFIVVLLWGAALRHQPALCPAVETASNHRTLLRVFQ